MTTLKNFGFIILELLAGLGIGILGGVLFSLIDKWDLFYSVLFTFISIFLAIPAGVGLVGYFHLRYLNRQKDFGQAFLLSILGLIVFILVYLILDSVAFGFIPHYLSSVVLPIFLPLMGTVIGFNFQIARIKTKRQVDTHKHEPVI